MKSLLNRLNHFRKKYSWLLIVGGSKGIKRLFDSLFSAAALIFLSPVFCLIALAIKLDDQGDVFHVVNRVGKWGEEFPFPKFRSMIMGAEKLENKSRESLKVKSDPRMTRIGRILRHYSLDELPQFWSVLVGHMSLVGPRPPLPHEVKNYTVDERRRLDVKPGLTGLWQISGRSDLPFSEMMRLDQEYIASQSLWLDIKILAKTVPAVLFGRGAY